MKKEIHHHLREDKRTHLQHSQFSVVTIREGNSDQDWYSPSTICVIERFIGESNTVLKLFCELVAPRPQAAVSTGSSPLTVNIALRENEAPQWWDRKTMEKAIVSALLPALITPTTGWAGTSIELKLVVELPDDIPRIFDSNLESDLISLQIVTTCVNAGSVTLMARGIPMRDLVIGSICALVNKNEKVLVDPTISEVRDAVAIVSATAMPSLGQYSSVSWYTSCRPQFKKVLSSDFAQFHSQATSYLLATAAAVRPILIDSFSFES